MAGCFVTIISVLSMNSELLFRCFAFFFLKIFILHIVIALNFEFKSKDAQQITNRIYLQISNMIFNHKLYHLV